MTEGETYLISKQIIGQVSESLTTMVGEEFKEVKGVIKTIQDNQAIHQEKDDEAFGKIEERGMKIDAAIPKIEEMYDSICGNEKLGMKGYNQRVKTVEDFAINQDRLNNRIKGVLLAFGVMGTSGWIGFIYELVKTHLK